MYNYIIMLGVVLGAIKFNILIAIAMICFVCLFFDNGDRSGQVGLPMPTSYDVKEFSNRPINLAVLVTEGNNSFERVRELVEGLSQEKDGKTHS